MFIDQLTYEKELNTSSDEDSYDSDQINSDIEAELYSVIHHDNDNSTLNYKSFWNSIYTSDKENNSSTNLECEKLRKSSVNFENSNQRVLNENDNSARVEIIEIADNFSESVEILNGSLQQSCNRTETLKRNFLPVENAHSFKKKQKVDSQYTTSNSLSSLFQNESVSLTSSEDDNDIIRLKHSDKNLSLSSDDDNDIICIEPSDKQKHFETNVSQITITDSDSDSADSWCFQSRNTSTPCTSKNKDPWYINDDDLYRSRRSINRYHESQSMTCKLCNQKGHSSKFCSFSKDPKCFICGGKHGSFRCSKRICAKCLRMGHDMKYCPKKIEICGLCVMPGHHHKMCPDLWRRFQRTIKGKKTKQVFKLFQDTPFFCYNCGLPGHFGPLCKNGRANAFPFPTWPCVLKYELKLDIEAKPTINAEDKESFLSNSPPQQVPKKKRKKKKLKNSPGVVTLQQVSFPRTPKNNNETVTETKMNSAENNSNLTKKQWRIEIWKIKKQQQKERRKQKRLEKQAAVKEKVN